MLKSVHKVRKWASQPPQTLLLPMIKKFVYFFIKKFLLDWSQIINFLGAHLQEYSLQRRVSHHFSQKIYNGNSYFYRKWQNSTNNKEKFFTMSDQHSLFELVIFINKSYTQCFFVSKGK